MTAFVVAADQVSKLVVRRTMALGQSVPIIPGLFDFTYVRNTGAAFGIMPRHQVFFVLVTAAVVMFILVLLATGHPHVRIARLALGLTLGGAVGNLIDRLSVGMVIDFLDFKVWPVFNLADSAIVVGTVVFVGATLLLPHREPDGRTSDVP